MPYNPLIDLPSIPTIPSMAPLHIGITTRVMATRQSLEREKNKEERNQNADEFEKRRRSSQFLTGARIPNSTIKLETVNSSDISRNSLEMRRKERDEFVDKLIKRLQPPTLHAVYDEDIDRATLNSIKKELQERSHPSILKDLDRETKTEKRSTLLSSSVYDSIFPENDTKDLWSELKEQRRITRRTSILAPLNGERRSTYESVKNAIQNSRVIQQLLNVDHIEEEKMKQIQTRKSLVSVPIKEELEEHFLLPQPSETKYKGLSKRKLSSKSEKIYTLYPKKSVARQKTFMDQRKHLNK